MRCVVVTGARLKANTLCAYCANKIEEGYIREIGSRRIYCDYRCYCVAAETAVVALSARARTAGAAVQRP
jgi:hypothetical protein